MVEAEDYARYLSEAARSENSILHEFRILYFSDPTAVHAFFEGEDDPLYFLPAVRSFTSREVHAYRCGGKPKIRSLREDVYDIIPSRTRVAFFVDRDYDDILGTQISVDQNTYLTDFYSVESDVACERAVEVILTDFAGLSRANRDFLLIVSQYKIARAEFEKTMAPITAWMLAAKAAGKKPNLSNVDLSKVVTLHIDGRVTRKKEGFKELQKSCGLSSVQIPMKELCRWRKHICRCETKMWIRGKFALWLFRKYMMDYLKHLLSDSKIKRKWKMPKPLQTGLLFEALAPRLPVPQSLQAFLATLQV